MRGRNATLSCFAECAKEISKQIAGAHSTPTLERKESLDTCFQYIDGPTMKSTHTKDFPTLNCLADTGLCQFRKLG